MCVCVCDTCVNEFVVPLFDWGIIAFSSHSSAAAVMNAVRHEKLEKGFREGIQRGRRRRVEGR